jgi:hypothetical protein
MVAGANGMGFLVLHAAFAQILDDAGARLANSSSAMRTIPSAAPASHVVRRQRANPANVHDRCRASAL